MMLDLNKVKESRPDIILFTQWDRFSRNIADAYYMLGQLRKLKIAVQAVDQPLDLMIPESKLLLAVHIAISEVENDRRSLNVKNGLRKARKEGRWIGHAPIGYINKTSEDGKKFIALHEPEASIVKRAFYNIAQMKESTSQTYRLVVESGLKCSRVIFGT